MLSVCHRAASESVWLFLALSMLAGSAHPLATDGTPALRWAEGQSGCTFSADDDGRYRYGLWTDDFGVVLAVDSLELQKALRRTEPIFAVLLTVRYRGKDSLSLKPETINLEFVKHYHDVQPALDPDDTSARLQKHADAFAQETEREIQKHPEKKAEKESALQEQQKTISDMREFLRTRSLRAATLDPSHPEINGWVLFRARSKWVGDWKKQEEFVLRIPLAERVLEFPFALPPSRGDLLLRQRPGN